MSRVQPITIKVLQEKSRRTGPAEGEGERHTKAAEERAAERLTIEESNNERLFGCRSVESSALTEAQTLSFCLHSVGLLQEKRRRKELTIFTGQEYKGLGFQCEKKWSNCQLNEKHLGAK